ncbi:hypothetical protein J3F84DRAFT_384820 [Trichoderma pleuroticola]
MWEIRRKLQSRRSLSGLPLVLGSTFTVVFSSPPVMAWRHPDVCNRHQKSQVREASCVYPLLGGRRVGFFPGAYGKSLRSLLRKLECDMQRLSCFWQDESHNSDHSVEGDASPFFFPRYDYIYIHTQTSQPSYIQGFC